MLQTDLTRGSQRNLQREWLLSYALKVHKGFPRWHLVKNPFVNAGDTGLIPGLAWSPGERHDNPLQYSWLENLMVRGTWCATVHGVTDLDTTKVT